MTEPTDKFVWRGWLTAWLIGVTAVVSGRNWLAVPAGVLIAFIGVMLVTNVNGVRDRLRVREERLRWHSGQFVASTYGGIVLMVIGLGWVYVGLGDPLG